MSPRPERRKSSLSGSSPVAPPQNPEPERTRTEEPSPPATTPRQEPEVQATAAPSAPAAKAPKSGGERKYRPKVSFYQDPEDTDRVRGAILHTMTTEGHRNLSQFIHHAVMAEVERLEQKYNGGKPFPGVGARDLPQGRPMGE